MKAFAYLRVSTKEQAEHDGHSRQLASVERYAAQHSIEIAQVFHESFTGGSEMTERKAFMDMVTALEANGIKTVLVEKLDRLARDLMVQESIIGDFQRRGFTILSTCEPDLCSNDPSRVLMRQMVGAFAQYEKAMILMRTRAAKDRIRARGERCEGQKPYGMTVEETKAISLMRSCREAGWSYDTIASHLNDLGHETRHGKTWYGCTVSKILAAQQK